MTARGGVDPSRGSGITGLRDRAEALGGSLSIDSRIAGGTTLMATFPVEDL
jgi:signal transduction histidine kinase